MELHEIEKRRHQIWSSTLIWLGEFFFNDSLINPLYMGVTYIEQFLQEANKIRMEIGRSKLYQFLPI